MDVAVVIVYILAMVAFGFWGKRKATTQSDFLVAGRRLGPFLYSGTMAAIGGVPRQHHAQLCTNIQRQSQISRGRHHHATLPTGDAGHGGGCNQTIDLSHATAQRRNEGHKTFAFRCAAAPLREEIPFQLPGSTPVFKNDDGHCLSIVHSAHSGLRALQILRP